MKKQIGIVTATRAEYGLLYPVIKAFEKRQEKISVKLIVTGAHLIEKFGATVKEIEKDGLNIDIKIPIITEKKEETAADITAAALKKFGEYFAKQKLDLVIVLGDRYELMGICTAAMLNNIPIAHLHGGETTEGAVDECIRHAVTKMSYLHFTSTQEYRKRVIQLGESPDRVFCVGAPGVENILKTPLLTKPELEKSIDFLLDKPYVVVTYHPVTLDKKGIEKKLGDFLRVVEENDNYKYIITKANADTGGNYINQQLEQFVKGKNNILLVASLGMRRYLSTLKYCEFVAGNSSSGIIEAPSFHVSTVNVGDRQRGRIQAESVINCGDDYEEIKKAFHYAGSRQAKKIAEKAVNPYGDGNTSEKIVKIVSDYLEQDKICLKKKFYDIDM